MENTMLTEMGAMPTGMPPGMPDFPGMQNMTSMGDVDLTCKISVSPRLCYALIMFHLN